MKKQPPQHDYYAILGVSKSASLGQIKHAYRQLAVRHHPDKSSDGEGRIVLINEAYATLKDPKKRADYDVYHAIYFSAVGKLTHKVAQKVSHTTHQSPILMANLKKIERHVTTFAHFAEQELRPVLLQNAKTLFNRLGNLMAQHATPNPSAHSPKSPNTMPTLIISPNLAEHGGQVNFTHQNQRIRTTLPKGLSDGAQIKLTMNGVATWFVIQIK